MPTQIEDDDRWACRSQAEYKLRCKQRELGSQGIMDCMPQAGDASGA